LIDREDFLANAGIDPRQPPAEALALFFRSFPLRFSDANARLPEEIADSGLLLGLEECTKILEEFCGQSEGRGWAFSSSWPWARIGDAIVAPGLPVRVSAVEEQGPDGIYHVADGEIRREAVGAEDVFLRLEGHEQASSTPFDLLCFGAMERYLLRGSVLEIEDLFCRTRQQISGNILERILLRELRMDPGVLDGLELPRQVDENGPPACLEIRRPAAFSDARHLDCAAVMNARADVRSAVMKGKALHLESEGGERAVFEIEILPDGWNLRLREGFYPLERLELKDQGDTLFLGVEPAPVLDLLAPGKRGRLAFDLHSDFVNLARL